MVLLVVRFLKLPYQFVTRQQDLDVHAQKQEKYWDVFEILQ